MNGALPSRYADFAAVLTERSAIRARIESDDGVLATIEALHAAARDWWGAHAERLARLPERRDLNGVRAEFLDTFHAALSPAGVLDRFRLAGVVAGWWNDSLPDLKTLMEQGFAGVIDGWVDAIADALDDDEGSGPLFDPFAHKLVLATMADYLERIAHEKAEIARLKAEKEAWEAQNPPEDEEEADGWNYARDLERRIREAKAEIKADQRRVKEIDKVLKKPGAESLRAERAVLEARIGPVLALIAGWEADLEPYEALKEQLAAARARYRALIGQFLVELQRRCGVLGEAEKQTLVLELLERDVLAGLQAANRERQAAIRFVENLWDKYRVTLADVRRERAACESRLESYLAGLGYQ